MLEAVPCEAKSRASSASGVFDPDARNRIGPYSTVPRREIIHCACDWLAVISHGELFDGVSQKTAATDTAGQAKDENVFTTRPCQHRQMRQQQLGCKVAPGRCLRRSA